MASNAHRRPPLPAIVLVVVILAAGGWWWWSSQGGGADESTAFAGTVESTEYRVASAIGGRITTVTVGEGDVVAAGDVLARLDARAFDLQLEQAKQGVKAAQAQVRQATDDGTDAEVDVAAAKLEQAKAAVKLVEVQRGYTTIKAPTAGVVTALSANVGENASPGNALMMLADPADLWVRVYVAEPRLGEVNVGKQVTVLDGEDSYPGSVTFVATEAEFTPNTVETEGNRANLVYEVRIRVDAEAGELRPGLPVDIELGALGRP